MKALAVLTIAVFTLLIYTIPALSATINIPDDYATIQAGIDASNNGDTVLVQPGTYVENINFNGHSIVLGSLYLTTGSSSYISSTIIDGDSLGTVVTVESGEDSTTTIIGFTIQNGLNYAAGYGGGIYNNNVSSNIISNIIKWNTSTGDFGGGIYCGFSDVLIANNTIIENHGQYGGGIGCINSDVSIINNTITNNTTAGGGGGIIFDDNSNGIIHNNVISNNIAIFIGGGILCFNSSPEITNNYIEDNIAYLGGGGIHCSNSHSLINLNVISGNIVTENTVSGGGGGIECCTSKLTFTNNIIYNNSSSCNGSGIHCYTNSIADTLIMGNNLFYGNHADKKGGGLYVVTHQGYYSPVVLINNTFVNNTADQIGGGIFVTQHFQQHCKFYNTISWGNMADSINEISGEPIVTYSNIQGGFPGEGNIDCDPMFCNPNNDDYYLAFNSCCVGAGCDSLGNPDPTVHIGAYGIGCFAGDSCVYIPGDINGDGLVIGGDVIFGVRYFKGSGNPPLVQCYDEIAGSWLYSAGDVNGDCLFMGSDITYLVRYFSGEGSPLQWCPQTPPLEE